jgi:hypothetical protein
MDVNVIIPPPGHVNAYTISHDGHEFNGQLVH